MDNACKKNYNGTSDPTTNILFECLKISFILKQPNISRDGNGEGKEADRHPRTHPRP